MTLRLHTIICSTRPGRVGPAVAQWFQGVAEAHGGFEALLVDLAEFDLPVFNEAAHPRLRKYEHAHTKSWSGSVAEADAFVFVTPEYNYGPPPSFVNALNYLFFEWNHKPAGFVSYGGVSGGLRGVQMEKLMLTSVKVMPIPEQVSIAMVSERLDGEGGFRADERLERAGQAMLDELRRWAEALKPLHTPRG